MKEKKSLTPEMVKIMNHTTKEPVIISADAGSGKTFTLLNKAVRLVENGGKALILSFSNESVEDLNKRISDVYRDKIIAMTFHSYLLDAYNSKGDKKLFISPVESAMLERKYMKEALEESKDNFLVSSILTTFKSPIDNLCSIYHDISSKSSIGVIRYIDSCIMQDRAGMHKKLYYDYDIAKIESILDREGVKLDVDENDFVRGILSILRSFHFKFNDMLYCNNMITYDMVEFLDYDLLKFNLKSQQITSLLIDEFQDVNERQNSIVKYIESLPFIEYSYKFGDSKQSIYKFRGCDNSFFKERMELEKCFELTQNFRTNDNLLKLFNDRLKNKYGLHTKTRSVIRDDYSFEVIEAITKTSGKEKYEVQFDTYKENNSSFKTKALQMQYINTVLVDKIKQLLDSSKEVAILVSKRSELNKFRPLMEEFSLSKKEANLADSNEFKMPYFLIKGFLDKNDKLLNMTLKNLGIDVTNLEITESELKRVIDTKKFKEYLKNKIMNNIDMTDDSVDEVLEIFIDNQYFYKKNKNDKKTIQEHLEDTVSFIERIFASDIVVQSKIKDNGKIRILTKHASKGLEFDAVVNIVNKNAKTLKSPVLYSKYDLLSDYYSIDDKGFLETKDSVDKILIKELERSSEKEQEINLEYVAMTRAKKHYLEVII